METPINRRNLRPRHVPTPKMSERKKSLFPERTKSPVNLPIDEDSDLGPISPLNFSSSSSHSSSHHPRFNEQQHQSAENLVLNKVPNARRNLRISFRNILNDINGSKSNVISPRSTPDDTEEARTFEESQFATTNDNASDPFNMALDGGNKENINMKTPSEQIKTGTNLEIQPKFRKIALEPNDQTPPTAEEPVVVHSKAQKRHYVSTLTQQNSTNPNTNGSASKVNSIIDSSPKSKFQKIDSKARTSLSFDEFIPTKFYSKPATENTLPIHRIKSPEAKSISNCNLSTSSDNYRRTSSVSGSSRKSLPARKSSTNNSINRGVFHRVLKRRPKSIGALNEPSRVDSKFNMIKLKLLKKSILHDKTEEERETTRITMEQVKRINNILRNMKNPIEMAQPLTVFNAHGDDVASTIETDDFDDTASSVSVSGTTKKFFKSQSTSSVKHIYRITNRLSASVENGRISLVPKKNKYADFSLDEIDFTDERKEVEGIIDKLYDTFVAEDQNDDHELNTSGETEPETVDDQMEYFRAKLPPASDPNELERQENLLQFLTMNYMLDDYHFKVFILEPNAHAEEAKLILDQLIVVDDPIVGTNNAAEAEFYSDCPMSPTSQISNMTSELALECPMEAEEETAVPLLQDEINVINNNSDDKVVELPLTERNFPIFDKGFRDRETYSAPKPKRSSRLWIPIGADQFQIDAGQKKFGATKCGECGLLYTAHEPEEEIIHVNFHNSLNLLRYKGWQNERAVAEVAEWGILGRIIMVVGSDQKFKLNRVKSIIKIADKDLGCAHIELHSNSVVYLAIGKNIIMGFCVAEPIPKAYRLSENPENGTTFYDANQPVPIKCGISKIWVAEAFRNQGVARHLINAVRSNFIFGYCLSFNELAFSSPTESGRIFARKLTNRDDILVYE